MRITRLALVPLLIGVGSLIYGCMVVGVLVAQAVDRWDR